MHVTLRNEVEELPRLADGLDSFCAREQLPEAVAYALQLIAEEMFVNIVRHGFSGETPGDVQVLLERSPSAVTLEFRDRGHPFHPLHNPRPDVTAPVTERPIGGLGVEFTRRLADDQIDYERIDGENRLRIRLPLVGS